jgi:hypothetical protein
MTDDPKSHPHELISALLDGEATVPERAAVERHLLDCAECRALLGDLRILAAAGASLQPPPVPAGLLAAIRARLQAARGGAGGFARAPARRRWTGLWRLPLPVAAAAGLMVAFAAFWLFRDRTAPPLQADRSGPVELEGETRVDQPIPGEPAEPGVPEEKQAAPEPPSASRPPAPPPVQTKPAPASPPAGVPKQERPPPSPRSEAIILRPSADEGAGTSGAPAARVADLARELDRAPAGARKSAASAPQSEAVPGATAMMARANQEREIVFEFPEYSGSISEGGMIALGEGEDRCAIGIGDSPAVRAQIASLFALASSAEIEETGSERPLPEGGAKEAGRGRIALRTPDGATAGSVSFVGAAHDVPSSSMAEIGRRIRALIQGPLRDPLENRCGRLPGAAAPDPAD